MLAARTVRQSVTSTVPSREDVWYFSGNTGTCMHVGHLARQQVWPENNGTQSDLASLSSSCVAHLPLHGVYIPVEVLHLLQHTQNLIPVPVCCFCAVDGMPVLLLPPKELLADSRTFNAVQRLPVLSVEMA